ncbi:Globin, putative [Luminiphilus syltensis NOR5-1B]|uniref:Globin, putative n=1 Tax=Luminiphilus syltensis NOR5-1B TaxID=565045 RepID=B8KU06_9GAMM|nr:globin [Luminiphilus syltensis]EED36499.1 Globin, putative [Luminiphilus syltensis NOR5-1B]
MQQSFDEIFSASYERVLGAGAYNEPLIAGFYDRFLASSTEIADRFRNTDMSRQMTMLHDSLQTLVDFNRQRRLSPQMSRLATVHARKGHDIRPELYGLWLDALLATVAETDPDWSDDVELAWRLTLAPGIAYLQYGYEAN